MQVDSFHRLTQFLVAYQSLWQFDPFHLISYPDTWSRDLVNWLESFSDARLLNAHAALSAPGVPSVRTCKAQTLLPEIFHPVSITDRFFHQHIPGRKLQQIRYFAGALPGDYDSVLEWCAGKGHLGRLLGHHCDCSVVSLERQLSLCRTGSALAQAKSVQQQFACVDVLHLNHLQLDANTLAVALHACGDLHARFLQNWSGGGQLACAPCCYHLSESVNPLSQIGGSGELVLRRQDLSFPLQALVTAGQSERRLRNQQLLWRMGFDEWQRWARASDDYLPLPAISRAQMSAGFESFMTWAAGRYDLTLDAGFNADHWLARAKVRVDRVNRMEWVRDRFRRPLEVWLAMDRALLLAERGAQVKLVEFCPRPLTPRNIMILAR